MMHRSKSTRMKHTDSMSSQASQPPVVPLSFLDPKLPGSPSRHGSATSFGSGTEPSMEEGRWSMPEAPSEGVELPEMSRMQSVPVGMGTTGTTGTTGPSSHKKLNSMDSSFGSESAGPDLSFRVHSARMGGSPGRRGSRRQHTRGHKEGLGGGDDDEEEEDDVQLGEESAAPYASGEGGLPLEAEDDPDRFHEDYCCVWPCKVKLSTLKRLVKVMFSYPFVLVLSAVPSWRSRSSQATIHVMNILIFFLPFVLVDGVLKDHHDRSVVRGLVAMYSFLYLAPVAFVVVRKLWRSMVHDGVEDGTFCFRPHTHMRFTLSNSLTVMGFVLEFLQHALYCFPLGTITRKPRRGRQEGKFEGITSITFESFFWLVICGVFLCSAILIANATLRGKAHYRLSRSTWIWFFVLVLSGPLYVTVVTILFQALSCDYSIKDDPVLTQDSSIHCWTGRHIRMAVAALMALGIYLCQATLLPSGTFKETMRNTYLDVLFVPTYLQMHFFLKALFCGIYVSSLQEDWFRITALTFLNVLLLILNYISKPCPIESVNYMRNCFLLAACLSGVKSLMFLATSQDVSLSGQDESIRVLFLLDMGVTWLILFTVGFVVYFSNRQTADFKIAHAFLDLNRQVAIGGKVEPRVMEPLISLTTSDDEEEREVVRGIIPQLCKLVEYPNTRIQFQSLWAISNIALWTDEDRARLCDTGVLHAIFGIFVEADVLVQLEALASLVNISVSPQLHEVLVEEFRAIPLLIKYAVSGNPRVSQFACMALANLAAFKDQHREQIMACGGVPTLVGCVLQEDYAIKRYACMALANILLCPSVHSASVFESKHLLHRIIKIALRKEPETQREVAALLRNLSVHSRLRPLLLETGALEAITAMEGSVFDDVLICRQKMAENLQAAILERNGHSTGPRRDTTAELNRKLQHVQPLLARMTWSSWGSKLDFVFAPVFYSMPTISNIQVFTRVDHPVQVSLLASMARRTNEDGIVFSVRQAPTHGQLQVSDSSNTSVWELTYIPRRGFVGADFFTFRASNGVLDSNDATVAISVDSGPKAGKARAGHSGPQQEQQEQQTEERATPARRLSRVMSQAVNRLRRRSERDVHQQQPQHAEHGGGSGDDGHAGANHKEDDDVEAPAAAPATAPPMFTSGMSQSSYRPSTVEEGEEDEEEDEDEDEERAAQSRRASRAGRTTGSRPGPPPGEQHASHTGANRRSSTSAGRNPMRTTHRMPSL